MRARTLFAVLALFAGEAHAQAVAAGADHGLALSRDGQVHAWGSDRFGQLGGGSVMYRAAPGPLAGLPPLAMVATGSAAVSAAVSLTGEVWTWGLTQFDGDSAGSSTPSRVEGLSDVVQVAVGHSHFAALKRDGSVWTWGHSSVLALGYIVPGPYRFLQQPRRVELLPKAVSIAAGSDVTIALAADGNAWFVGSIGFSGSSGLHRIDVPDVVAVAAGKFGLFALVLKRDGTVWGLGSNYDGALGDGSGPGERTTPVQVRGLPRVKAISAGMSHAGAIAEDGSVWMWGSNTGGQLGTGNRLAAPTAVRVEGLSNVTSLDAGMRHTLAADVNGVIWGWGVDVEAITNGLNSTLPVRIAAPEGVRTVHAASTYSVALTSGGTALTWGSRLFGQLGDGSAFQRSSPLRLAGLPPVATLWTGNSSSFAATADGRVWGWGSNSSGELGDGTQLQQRAPTRLPHLDGVTQISSGYHSLALRPDGTVLAWGSNVFGALGNGSGPFLYLAPSVVPNMSDVVAVASGEGFSLALKRDGSVWSWGNNRHGQLGDGTTNARPVPAPIPGIADVIAISTRNDGAGAAHAMALKRDGTVWTWGLNHAGQLGDGTLISRSVPTIVPGLEGVVAIAAGFIHSLALKGDGSVWAWGSNAYGQLGDGTNVHRPRPVRVQSLAEVASISAGKEHSMALKADGTAWAWGRNDLGKVGDGSFVHRMAPAVVLSDDGAGTIAANDWFLRLDDRVVPRIPDDKAPRFQLLAQGAQSDISATIRFREADVGKPGRAFVFALAPAAIVKRLAADAPKDAPVGCVLAQLNRNGELVATSASDLQAFFTGILSANGASVSVLNGAPTANVAGATFFVGYGPDGAAMVNGGVNRSAVAVDGAVRCAPQAPETGWWWNPAEDGRGFSIEARGSNLFFASFLYDLSGRSTWYVSSGPSSLDGSFYAGELLAARGGQTLGGAYAGFPALERVGAVTLAFNTADQGTIIWPGGVVPIQRFDIIPNGRSLPAVQGQPESGWWWNEQEPGRGFFMEWQNGTLDIAGYMYDEAGNPVWYLTVGPMSGTSSSPSFSGSWWSYGNGQTLTGPWKPNARTSSNVAALSITFSGADTALMTLPNGRTSALRRHRF